MKGFHEIIPSVDESELEKEKEKEKEKKKKSGDDLDDLDAEKKKKMKTSLEKLSGDQEAVKMEKSSGEEEDDVEDVKMENMGDDSFLVDSSGEELSDSDKAQFYKYHEQLIDSGGFDIDYFPYLFPITHSLVGPLEEGCEKHLKLCRFSEKAIYQYNSDHGTNYKFFKYLKSVSAPCSGEQFYITFEAKEAKNLSSEDAPATIFQGLVWDKIPTLDGTKLIENFEVRLVRKKSEATKEHNHILLG